LLHGVIVNDINDTAPIADLGRRMNCAVARKCVAVSNPANFETHGFRHDLAAQRFVHKATASRCFRMLALRPASWLPTRPISSREFESMEAPQCA
jgi:hypothetical protein